MTKNDKTIRIYGFTPESIVDGPGIRVVVFTQGCENACANCHNPESWDASGGNEYTVRDIVQKIKNAYTVKSQSGALSTAFPRVKRKGSLKASRKIQGLTFSGGEPFMQAAALAQVARAVKPLGLDITTYTGYVYEDLVKRDDAAIQELLNITDYLIDGPYIHSLRDIGLKFRGSSNQRIIDMEETRRVGGVVLYSEGPVAVAL